MHPVADPALRIISQRFGENPWDYAKFGLAGHNGIDFAVPVGTPIHAVDNGRCLSTATINLAMANARNWAMRGANHFMLIWAMLIWHCRTSLSGEAKQLVNRATRATTRGRTCTLRCASPYTRAPYDGYVDQSRIWRDAKLSWQASHHGNHPPLHARLASMPFVIVASVGRDKLQTRMLSSEAGAQAISVYARDVCRMGPKVGASTLRRNGQRTRRLGVYVVANRHAQRQRIQRRRCLICWHRQWDQSA